MSPRIVFSALLSAVVFCAASATTSFGCDHCGCAAQCQKTCRLVCETKKVDVVCWGCKCEDFCVPGPSKLCSKHCEMVCDECDTTPDAKGVCYQPHKFVWNEWIPGCCAKVHTKKKLMKKTITKTIPSYKWVVENLCPQCQAHAQSAPVPAGTELPQLPAFAAQTKVLPVGTAVGNPFPDVIQEVEEDAATGVQAASFTTPTTQPPYRQPEAAGTQHPFSQQAIIRQSVPTVGAAPPASPATKSWSDSVKALWQR